MSDLARNAGAGVEALAVAAGRLRSAGPVRFARMGGSSIATPAAGGWVTDFLNAAYFARGVAEREVDDLRLAFCVLTSFWERLGRRLRLSDLGAFHRAYGAERAGSARRGASPTLDREQVLAGAEALLGPGFADGYADPARRGWGIVFAGEGARRAYAPERRLADGRLRELTPPRRPPDQQRWHTYRPVALPSAETTLALLAGPERWPEFGSELGRFTAVRSGGLSGQTFEIEVVASPTARTPVFTRGYVTVTRVLDARGDRAELDAYVQALAEVMARVRPPGGDRPLPPGGSPYALLELTTHDGHFLGAAISRLLIWEHEGRAYLRDIGSWDPLPAHLAIPYRLGGHRSQMAFWGDAAPQQSMPAQIALLAD